jgi:chromosome segregation ATPase
MIMIMIVSAGFFRHRRRGLGGIFAAVVSVMLVFTICGCAILERVPVKEDLVKEEKVLTENINNESNPFFLAEAYLSRARLRLRADNPRIDYDGALEDLKKAVDLNPEISGGKDIRDWIAALVRLTDVNQEVAQLKAKNEQTERQNRTLRSNIEQLEKQEQELRKTIEELQALELQMEQRRQQLR